MTNRAKKRLLLLGVSVVIAGGGVVGLQQLRNIQSARTLKSNFEEGMAAHEAGRHKDASTKLWYYVTVAQSDDVDGEALLAFVESRRQTPDENGKHLLESILVAKRARDLMPSDVRPLEHLLALYGITGQFSERLDAANRLLAIDDKNYEGMKAKISSFWRLGERDQALQVAQSMAEVYEDDIFAHSLVLQLYEDLDKPKREMLDYAQAVSKKYPDDARFTLLVAQVHAAANEDQKAREIAQQALGMDISDAVTLRELLLVLDRLGMTAEAAAVIDRETAKEGVSDEFYAIAAERAWKESRISKSLEYIRRASVDPESAKDNVLGWRAFLEQGATDVSERESIVEILRGRGTPEAATWISLLRAQDAMAQSDWALAQEELRTAQTTDDGNSLAIYMMGETERRLGEWRAAIERWGELRKTEPTWVRLHVDLASALLDHEFPAEAYIIAARGAQVAPNQVVMAPVLARASMEVIERQILTGTEAETPLAFLEELREKLPPSGFVQSLLARAYAALDRPAEAKEAIEVIFKNDLEAPSDSLGPLLAMNKRYEWGFAEQIRAVSPESPASVFTLAIEAHQAGDTKAGMRMLRNAVESHEGGERLAYELRLAAYQDLVDAPEALENLSRIGADNPQSAEAQRLVLNSRAAWRDEKIVSSAIASLRNLAGNKSSLWRVAEARRLLTFSDPNNPNDRQDKAARVVNDVLKSVITNDPRAGRAHELAAEAWLILDERNNAIHHLELALAAQRDAIRLYPKLISLFQQAGDAEGAKRYLQKFSQQTNITPEMQRRRAALLVSQNMIDPAMDDFRSLAQAGDVRAQVSLAALHSRLGEVGQAREMYEQALRHDDELAPFVAEAAAEYFASQGEMDRARSILTEHLKDAGREGMLAALLMRHGLAGEAEDIYTRLAQSENSGAAWSDLARFYLSQRRVDEAEQAISQGLAVAPDDENLIHTASMVSMAGGEEIAAEGLSDALTAFGLDPDSRSGIALQEALDHIQANPTDLDGYIDRLRRLVERDATFYPAWQMLVQAHMRKGDVPSALEVAQSATQSLPADPRPAKMVTELLMRQGRTDQAIAAAKLWRERALANPYPTDLLIAQLNDRMGRYEEGLGWLAPYRDRIIREGDTAPTPLELLASLHAGADQEEIALELLWDRAQESQAWRGGYLRAGYRMFDRPAEAREWFERVTPLMLSTTSERIAMGRAWYDLGVQHVTREDFQRTVDIVEPALDDPDARGAAAAFCAACYEQLNQPEEAERLYRVAISENPGQADLKNNLAFLILTQGGSLEEALALATSATESSLNIATFFDTKGQVLFKLGRAEEAETAFRQGLEIDPADPLLLIGLAEALHAQKEFGEAQRVLSLLEAMNNFRSGLSGDLTARYNSVKSQLRASGGD